MTWANQKRGGTRGKTKRKRQDKRKAESKGHVIVAKRAPRAAGSSRGKEHFVYALCYNNNDTQPFRAKCPAERLARWEGVKGS